MTGAPFRTTFLCSLFVLAGCLNNPSKPSGDDGGAEGSDGSGTLGDVGLKLDTAVTPTDGRADVAPDLQTPLAEPPPDGAVVEVGGGPEGGAGPEVNPDTSSCPATCTEGAKRCGSGGGLQTCVLVAGCPDWGAEATCGPNATCTGTAPAAACTCKPAPSCNGPGTFCQNASTVGTCARDSFGCVYVTGATTTCAGGQLCGGNAPNGACGCSNTCSPTQVGTYCVDADTVATCTASNGCFASSGATTCPGRQTCEGTPGTAACKCPATGTTEGSGCATAGATLCQGNLVLTCTTEAGSNCRYWARTTDCAAATGGPYVCGTRGGSPACQCPDPSTTNIYVDPVAGRDTGTIVPNGANTPASCRYKTLTKGLTAVTSTRRRVVATTASPPASFTDETFPMAIPSNVTLDTADTTPTPANYTIVFDSATAAAALELETGAIVEGYTIQAATGNVAASTISCTAGSVTVRNCVLVGASSGASASKPATGIAIGTSNADTCTGTLSNLNVRNYRTGVSVTTASATALTISNSTLRDNGQAALGAALLIAQGKVTATSLIINKSSAGVATWGVVMNGSSGSIAPTLTATGLDVSGIGRAGLHMLAAAGMLTATATLTGGEIQAGASADPGVHVAAGTLTMNGTNVHGAGSDGLRLESGLVSLGAATRLDSNGRDGLRLLAGTVTIGANTGTQVSIAGNTENGITVAAPGPASTLSMNRAHIQNSGKTGLEIDLAAAGGQVTVTDTDINGNLDGISIIRAPSAGGDAVSLTNVRVYSNGRTGPGGVGVAFRGDTGSLTAALKNSSIHNNRDQGVLIRQGATFTTTVTLDGNDVYDNNTGAGAAVGGIFFATSSTLSSFAANKIHGNTGDEVGFDAQPNGGTTWDLSGPIACTTPTQIYCYAPAGGTSVGLRILDTAPMNTAVNAANISWSSIVPTKGTDFEFDMTKFTVTVLPACSQVVATCN